MPSTARATSDGVKPKPEVRDREREERDHGDRAHEAAEVDREERQHRAAAAPRSRATCR